MDVLNVAWTRMLARTARWHATPEQESERGQTLAEYSLLMGIIAVGAIVALTALGAITTGLFWEPINHMFEVVVDLVLP